MPNWKKLITSGSHAQLSAITMSGNIIPDSDNTHTLGTSTNRFQLNGGTPVTVGGSGNVNFVPRFSAATEVQNSTITNTNTLTTIVHSNDTNDIFIVSGSNGELLKVQDSASSTLFQVNDTSGISQFEVSSSGDVEWVRDLRGHVPQVYCLHGEVLDSVVLSGNMPWNGINIIDQPEVGYWSFIAPHNGYFKNMFVHPHRNATSGNVTIQPILNGADLGSSVTRTISATAGTETEYTFGSSSYSFNKGDRLNINIDRVATNRAQGFGMTVTLILDTRT